MTLPSRLSLSPSFAKSLSFPSLSQAIAFLFPTEDCDLNLIFYFRLSVEGCILTGNSFFPKTSWLKPFLLSRSICEPMRTLCVGISRAGLEDEWYSLEDSDHLIESLKTIDLGRLRSWIPATVGQAAFGRSQTL